MTAAARPLPVDAWWNAVATRDAAFDDTFVYAVLTTGIFCRASCPSRRPRRENARFFPAAADAARAGFRPCKRCKPTTPRTTEDPRVTAVRALVDQHLTTGEPARLTLNVIAERVGLSPFHLHRLMRDALGMPLARYVRARREARLKQSLREGRSVSQATFDAGFGSSSRVYERASASLGMTPGAYRRGGQGVRITWTIADTKLGAMCIAGTEQGVCHVAFGDNRAALEQELRAEFPRAKLVREPKALQSWVEDIKAQLDGRARSIDVPLDIDGTDFQRQVWTELRRIPFGETRSYQELAITLGRPTAARAVARACASNRIAVVIPCHRVVRGTGELGGYRWGIARKQVLLREIEG